MIEVNIKDFKGMNPKEALWDKGFAGYSLGMDFYGLADDNSNISIPGVLQGALSLSTMGQAPVSTASAVTALISDFAYYPTSNNTYAIDTNTTSRIYRYDQSNSRWTYVSSINVSGGQVGTLAGYNANLYYATNNYLGVYDGTNGNANFQQFSQANVAPRPLKVFAGMLFAGNGRYVDRYDGSTYQSQKLTLPSDFVVRSMEVFRDALYISADNNSQARIFVWDGSSPTFQDQIPLFNEAYAPSLVAGQGFLWIVGNRGNSSSTQVTPFVPIYVYQYQVPELLFNLPIKRDNSTFTTGVATYQGGILIGSSEGTTSSYEDGVGGLWYIGKDINTGMFHASLLFSSTFSGTQTIGGGVFSAGRTQTGTVGPAVYYSVSASGGQSFYNVFQVAGMGTSNQFFGGPIYTTLPIDAGSTTLKSWVAMRCNFDTLSTGQYVEVFYALDRAPNNTAVSWTLLKTYVSTDPSTDKKMRIPIGRTSRTISFRIILNRFSGSSVASPKFHELTVYAEPSGT